jgi:hypothetical protein
MVENSETSVKSEKLSTKKTSSLTPDQALQILQQSVINCQHAGVNVKFTPLYHQGQQSVIMVLTGCNLIDGNIVLVKKG